jgi:ADP-heptose:LPS heptosyltransferase
MKRAAIISDKQLGDVTLLEPLSRLLAKRTGKQTALFVNQAFRPLIDLMPNAAWGPETQEFFGDGWTTNWSSRAVLRSLNIKCHRKNLLANQKKHIRWWYHLIFNKIQINPIGEEYWARYFWLALGGDKESFESPQLNQPPDDWKHPELPNKPFILINPTAAWPSKFWMAESWSKVIDTSLTQCDMPWVMTGGSSDAERQHCEDISAATQKPIIDLAGRTSLKQYLHAISRANLVICVDGSASHLAQAFKVPAITLFGPVYEVKWHWATPKHRALSSFRLSNMRPISSAGISSDAVISELTSMTSEYPEILTTQSNHHRPLNYVQ